MSERLRPFRNFEGHEFSIIYNANNNVKNKVHPQAVVLESVHYTTTVFIFWIYSLECVTIIAIMFS